MRVVSISAVIACFLPAAASAAPGDRAGVVSASQGAITRVMFSAPPAERQRGIGKELATGNPVFLGDEIKTGPNSRLQILLLDETSFTIGPDSSMTIDEFVYDPRSGAGKVAARINKGVFRFVSGKIAADKPENVSIRLPIATVGIRGTTVYGFTDGGNTAKIGLGGPGRNALGQRVGKIVVTSGGPTQRADRSRGRSDVAQAGPPGTAPGTASVEITRPNFGVEITGAGNISAPMNFTQQAQIILNALAPPKSPPARPGTPPGTQTAAAGSDPVAQSGVGFDASNRAAVTEVQTMATASDTNAITSTVAQTIATSAPLMSGQTTVGQLLAMNSGVLVGTGTVVLQTVSGTGTTTNTTTFTLDFGARTIGFVSTSAGTIGPLTYGGAPFSASGSYANGNPSSPVVFGGTTVFTTAFGPLNSTRMTIVENTAAGIARNFRTTLTQELLGNVHTGTHNVTMQPQ